MGICHSTPATHHKRIANNRNILFVEEPIHGPTRVFSPHKNVTFVQPFAPSIDSPEFVNTIKQFVEAPGQLKVNQETILWFYSLSFITLAQILSHDVIIYDCVDELSLFRGAPLPFFSWCVTAGTQTWGPVILLNSTGETSIHDPFGDRD